MLGAIYEQDFSNNPLSSPFFLYKKKTIYTMPSSKKNVVFTCFSQPYELRLGRSKAPDPHTGFPPSEPSNRDRNGAKNDVTRRLFEQQKWKF